MYFGSSKYKNNMLRRFFQRFKQGIKCLNCQHVYLVYDIDTFFQFNGCVTYFFHKSSYTFNTVITCGIYFNNARTEGKV